MAFGNVNAVLPSVTPVAYAPASSCNAQSIAVTAETSATGAQQRQPQAPAPGAHAPSATKVASTGRPTATATDAGTEKSSFTHILAKSTASKTSASESPPQSGAQSHKASLTAKNGKPPTTPGVTTAVSLPAMVTSTPAVDGGGSKVGKGAPKGKDKTDAAAAVSPARTEGATVPLMAVGASVVQASANAPTSLAPAVLPQSSVAVDKKGEQLAQATRSGVAEGTLSAQRSLSEALQTPNSTAGGNGSSALAGTSDLSSSVSATAGGQVQALAHAAIRKLESTVSGTHNVARSDHASPASSTSLAHTGAAARSQSSSIQRSTVALSSSSSQTALAAVSVPTNAVGPTSTAGGSQATSLASTSSASGQISTALFGVGQISGNGTPGQGTRLTIALAPPAIGTVTLQIDRNSDGSSSVGIGATHLATLDQLQSDRSALEQMLTQAGIPPTHRTITFNILNSHGDGGSALPLGAGSAGAGHFAGGGQASAQSQGGNGAAPRYVPPANADQSAMPRSMESIQLPRITSLRRFGVNVMA